MWTRLGALLVLAGTIRAISREQLYPYGPTVEDSELPKGPDVSSAELQLKVPVIFYGETYESIFVNNGGVVSFRAEIPSFLNSEFPLPYPSIAAFYTNVDTTDSGAVYYRETDEQDVLSKAEESVRNNFQDYQNFQPTSVFLTTWIDVTYSNAASGLTNSFQIAIISNGTESFVELLYPGGEIQWIQKAATGDQMPEAKAQAGFVAEDGRMYTLKGSGSHQVRNIMSWSNVRQPGKYLFRVGIIPYDGNIALPDQYNPDDYDEEEVTCARSGSNMCHNDARCVDYETGICCQCNGGYYGNGKSCIKNDVPLRLHGKLNGIINTISLNDVDIQAYVVVNEGRSYTALSQGPPAIGGSLQLLNVIGDVVGWLFAKPIGNAKNGYQLTGSTFNHTADVFFPETGDRVTITQQYLGHDVFDQVSLEADVRGTLPYVAADDKIALSEYEEQFSQIESGLIRSESIFTFYNKRTGQQYQQKVSQTFTYSPCKFAPLEDLEAPLTLKSTKNHLSYESKHNVVRYGMMTTLTPFSNEDPCIRGRNECGPLSTCVVQGNSYRCVCKAGYTNIYRVESSPCEDIDECSVGTHNCDTNADCYNHEGGFRCLCREGFEGNGVRCTPASRCRNERCDSNAQCINTRDSFGEETICVCNPGFTGDGRRCLQLDSSSCELLRNCNPNADCVQSLSNLYECRCREGYVGDGYYCTEEDGQEEAPTTPPPFTSFNESEYNGTYFLPNCDSNNQCTCPAGYINFIDDRGNNLCRLAEYEPMTESSYSNSTATCESDRDCAPNALCTFGTCICPEGYEGNGFDCIERLDHACNCGTKASCVLSASKEPMCLCDQGYHYEGEECRPNFICTNNTDCEFNAECVLDSVTNEYVCQCVDGFKKDPNDACIADGALCNGAVCAEHASCLYDETIGLDYCYCDAGYEGEAIVRCVPHQESCEVRNNCHFDAMCTDNGGGFECVCKEGYIGDGFNCMPEPSCINNRYMCHDHASCLKRSEGYVCECDSGYFGNGSSCTINPRQTGNFLLASDGVFIYRVPFQVSARGNAVPINSDMNQFPVGLDVDCQAGKVYWGDVGTSSIKRASYDGSGYEVFLGNDVKSPEGIAIDWAARNIFWTDPKSLSIEVANMDTRLRKVLFRYDGIINPRGIAVHPQKGKIFWSDWNRAAPKIEWANMDGSERGVFLSPPDVNLPNALTIDWETDRLCYTDAGLKSIECVGIDDRRRETIASNCLYPFDLAVNDGKFYWTDWKTLKLEYLDTRTKSRGQQPVTTASRKLFGVAIAPEQCARYTNVCQYRNGNCGFDEICLPNGRGSRTCVPGF